MWWKKEDPFDKDALRLVEALLGQTKQKPSNVIDMTNAYQARCSKTPS